MFTPYLPLCVCVCVQVKWYIGFGKVIHFYVRHNFSSPTKLGLPKHEWTTVETSL